jgi:ubiquitin-protein ligase E3 C
LLSLDPELYRGLIKMKEYDAAQLAELDLRFEVTDVTWDGRAVTVPLLPGGSEMVITPANVRRYIMLVANYRLNAQIAAQCHAFLRGFRALIPLAWMRMFGPHELQV